MDDVTPTTTEIKIGGLTFRVTSHFKESSNDTIDSRLIRVMEQEQENRMINTDSS